MFTKQNLYITLVLVGLVILFNVSVVDQHYSNKIDRVLSTTPQRAPTELCTDSIKSTMLGKGSIPTRTFEITFTGCLPPEKIVQLIHTLMELNHTVPENTITEMIPADIMSRLSAEHKSLISNLTILGTEND